MARKRHDFQELIDIMARLRAPDGCPWDREQSLESLQAYLLEEAHEVLQAMDGGGSAAHAEELGDLLLQIIFQSQIAKEQGDFDIHDVVDGLAAKLLRRHPHVFGEEKAEDAEQVIETWERIKRREKGKKAASAIDGLPPSLPALLMAHKLGQRAARVGFDWPDIQGVKDKVAEELQEVEQAWTQKDSEEGRAHLAWELGDLLFALTNLCRHLGFDGENLLRQANGRFASRFRRVEELAQGQGSVMRECSIEELESFWQAAKKELDPA